MITYRIKIRTGREWTSPKRVTIQLLSKRQETKNWILSNFDQDRFQSGDHDVFSIMDRNIINPNLISISVQFLSTKRWMIDQLEIEKLNPIISGKWLLMLVFNNIYIENDCTAEFGIKRRIQEYLPRNFEEKKTERKIVTEIKIPSKPYRAEIQMKPGDHAFQNHMEKKLNPKMTEYSVEIKTESDLPKSGFDGVVVRLIGTLDSSNPIAINGMYTGRHQYFTVTLTHLGSIQKVFLNNIENIKIVGIKIEPKGAKSVLLTHVITNGQQMLVMKEYKYRVFTHIGKKLRKESVSLSIQFFGSKASTDLHPLLIEERNPSVGKDLETSFYDRDIGDLISCKLYYYTSNAGTDLYIQKIAVQTSKEVIMDQSELSIKWAGRQLFEINDWIKCCQKGVSYQYGMEMVISDEKTQIIRLSSSLNDFKTAHIPGSQSITPGLIARSRSTIPKKSSFIDVPNWSAMIATRHANCPVSKIGIKLIQSGNQIKIPLFSLKPDRIERIDFDSAFDIDRTVTVRITTANFDGEEHVFLEHMLLFNDSESYLVPISASFDRPHQTKDFEIGAKYRLYFYVRPGKSEIDKTQIELVGQSKQTISFELNQNLRKKYVQNCNEYDVFCYEYGGQDLHNVIGGRLWSTDSWYCKQIQIQSCRSAKNQRLNWTLAKIFTVEQMVSPEKAANFGKLSKTEYI